MYPRAVRILLVKPWAQLGPILGLQAFQFLEPVELAYLAAVVPREHEVQALDLRRSRRPEVAFRRTLARFRPDLIGFTGYSHEANTVKKLAAIARRELPTARIVVGGHHATVAAADYRLDSFDAVVRGEGCGPFAEIVGRCARGEGLVGLGNVLVPGAGWDDAAAAVWPRYPDPAGLPTPRRDLWDFHAYRSVWVSETAEPWTRLFPPVAVVRTSFGCTMKCSFCIVPLLCGGRHLNRPVSAVVDEIAALPVEHVYFCDDENFLDEAFSAELAAELERRKVRKRYFAWARATTVNRSPELMRIWREVGLDAAFLGFEFPSDEELRHAHKGASVAANERALDVLRSVGVAVHAGFMLQPEYSENEFDHLRRYVASLPPVQCSFTVCTPSPGTPDWAAMQPRMWVSAPYDLYDCMHPLVPTHVPLRRFARSYADLALDGIRRIPLRQERRPLRPADIVRVVRAERRYVRGLRELYRDYPRELWG